MNYRPGFWAITIGEQAKTLFPKENLKLIFFAEQAKTLFPEENNYMVLPAISEAVLMAANMLV